MINKEIKYGNAFRAQNRRANQKKQPFPKIYANRQEDYELFETDKSQLETLSVETGIKFDCY